MPTRKIVHCLERLRGLQQCLTVVLDSSAGADANAAVFLSVEIKQAIDELERNMPTARMIGEGTIADLTHWPDGSREDAKGYTSNADRRERLLRAAQQLTREADELGYDAAPKDNTRATLTREAEMLANEHPEAKA